MRRLQQGFTLLEAMIVVAIVAIIAGLAIGGFSGNVDTAYTAMLNDNINGMRMFQEDTRLRTGSYGAGTFDPGAGTNTLTATTGWDPGGADDIKYVVTAMGGTSWTVVATHIDSGEALTKTCAQSCN